ncbi:MAG: sulfotransferase [Acidimicrobiales bacterium]
MTADLQDGTEPIRVLYLGGVGRSGSTLLELMLAETGGVTALGEVVHLWRRGIQLDELCSCRRRFSDCPFWTEVGERAFSGWESIDLTRLAELRRAVDRQRYLPLLGSPVLPAGKARAAAEYSELYRRLYQAAREVSGGLIIDSSKHPSLAYLLARESLIDLRVCHLVRDSRGVAHSQGRLVRRPEATDTTDYMHRIGPVASAVSWLGSNAAFEALARRRSRPTPVLRVRYEDLLTDPVSCLRRLRSFAGLEEVTDGARHLGRDGQPSQVVHSVAGNPLRFSGAPLRLRRDEVWRTEMSPADQRLVWAITAPLARTYGYRARR